MSAISLSTQFAARRQISTTPGDDDGEADLRRHPASMTARGAAPRCETGWIGATTDREPRGCRRQAQPVRGDGHRRGGCVHASDGGVDDRAGDACRPVRRRPPGRPARPARRPPRRRSAGVGSPGAVGAGGGDRADLGGERPHERVVRAADADGRRRRRRGRAPAPTAERRSTMVSGPGHSSAIHRPTSATADLHQLERLVEVGHQHGERVVRRPVLEREQVAGGPVAGWAGRPGRTRCRWAARPSRRREHGDGLVERGRTVTGVHGDAANRCRTQPGTLEGAAGAATTRPERAGGAAVSCGRRATTVRSGRRGRGGRRRRRGRPRRRGAATAGPCVGADLEHQRPRRGPATSARLGDEVLVGLEAGRSGHEGRGGLPVGDRRGRAPRRRRRRAGCETTRSSRAPQLVGERVEPVALDDADPAAGHAEPGEVGPGDRERRRPTGRWPTPRCRAARWRRRGRWRRVPVPRSTTVSR